MWYGQRHSSDLCDENIRNNGKLPQSPLSTGITVLPSLFNVKPPRRLLTFSRLFSQVACVLMFHLHRKEFPVDTHVCLNRLKCESFHFFALNVIIPFMQSFCCAPFYFRMNWKAFEVTETYRGCLCRYFVSPRCWVGYRNRLTERRPICI